MGIYSRGCCVMPIFWSGLHLIVSWTTGNVNANTENRMSLAHLEAEILHF